VQLNPNYAVVRLENGRETSVSLRDLSPSITATHPVNHVNHPSHSEPSTSVEQTMTQSDEDLPFETLGNSSPPLNQMNDEDLSRAAEEENPQRTLVENTHLIA
jgi:hypothetical protein